MKKNQAGDISRDKILRKNEEKYWYKNKHTRIKNEFESFNMLQKFLPQR